MNLIIFQNYIDKLEHLFYIKIQRFLLA